MSVALASKNLCLHRNLLFISARSLPCRRNASSAYAAKKQAKRKPQNVIEDTGGDSELSPDEQAEGVIQAQIANQKLATFDMWTQPTQALDVHIPYETRLWSRSKYSGIGERLSQWWANQTNNMKNLFSFNHVISYNSFPGVDLQELTWKSAWKYPVQMFSLRSTKPNSWTAPLRKILLDNYISMQTAIAKRDKPAIERLSQYTYLEEVGKLLRRDRSNTYIWNFHREVSPTQILSMRSIEGYLGKQPPQHGNRLLIQVLVKFDTEQSLEIYDPNGKALHTPDPDAPHKGRRVPAKKHRLTEYFLFEKRMYLQHPWQLKERIYPKPEKVVIS